MSEQLAFLVIGAFAGFFVFPVIEFLLLRIVFKCSSTLALIMATRESRAARYEDSDEQQ